jgi:hypothetical protein
MTFLKKYAFAVLVLDVLWAVLLATFGTSILSAYAGVPAESLTGVSGWILVFFAALFQGAIFAVVGSIFGTLALILYAKPPPAIQKLMAIALIADLIWGAVVATFGAGILGHASAQVGVDGTFSSVLFWFIAFVAGCFQGAVFIGVGSIFLTVVLVLIGSAAKGKSDSGRNISDRNPGEPPHR